ncbi:DNA repair and recombination protein pif1 [Mycena rebaudengoi]|nr:DNA repair and recombination protein pif1 [Mycena rebaudengoi]
MKTYEAVDSGVFTFVVVEWKIDEFAFVFVKRVMVTDKILANSVGPSYGVNHPHYGQALSNFYFGSQCFDNGFHHQNFRKFSRSINFYFGSQCFDNGFHHQNFRKFSRSIVWRQPSTFWPNFECSKNKLESGKRQFAIEICRLAGGANKCKGTFDARQLPLLSHVIIFSYPKTAMFPDPICKLSQSSSVAASSPTSPGETVASSHICGSGDSGALVDLNDAQSRILAVVDAGGSVFFTGSAGTGKTLLLKHIIRSQCLKYSGSVDAVAITASTGAAACSIGGVTIHSFAGIGLGSDSAGVLTRKVLSYSKALVHWRKVKVLIIDEVSMVDGTLFDKLSEVGKIMRGVALPFGGVQASFSFLFYLFYSRWVANKFFSGGTFAFQSLAWSVLVTNIFYLDTVFRQKDREFVSMLNEIRSGVVSPQMEEYFLALHRPLLSVDGVEATELFPRREEVDRANSRRLRLLPGDMKHFLSVDGGTVMLVKNLSLDLVNGTVGCVVGFSTRVARGIQNSLFGGDDADVLYPVVEFRLCDGNKKTVLMLPHVFKIELPSGEVQAFRCQLPLILAWAMSIHKSQGKTLDLVKVDLKKVFGKVGVM